LRSLLFDALDRLLIFCFLVGGTIVGLSIRRGSVNGAVVLGVLACSVVLTVGIVARFWWLIARLPMTADRWVLALTKVSPRWGTWFGAFVRAAPSVHHLSQDELDVLSPTLRRTQAWMQADDDRRKLAAQRTWLKSNPAPNPELSDLMARHAQLRCEQLDCFDGEAQLDLSDASGWLAHTRRRLNARAVRRRSSRLYRQMLGVQRREVKCIRSELRDVDRGA
jgi:hypothetical protein